MKVHHLFIVSEHMGFPADKLVELGFTEGSSRVHPGQGTQNRKFYFGNCYIEILWADNQDDLRSERVINSGLSDRINYRQTGFAPYGVCLEHDKQTDAFFQDAHLYFPTYFPDDWSIAVRHDVNHKSFPWFFRLPFKERYAPNDEPVDHDNGVKEITQIVFTLNNDDYAAWSAHRYNDSILQFESGSYPHLLLEFDGGKSQRTEYLEELHLTLTW